MRHTILGALALALAAGCGNGTDAPPADAGSGTAERPTREAPVAKDPDAALREELEGIWTEVRTAFAEYRLDDATRYLEVPEGAPRPTREQAAQLAEFLPDVRAGRFLRFEREGDVAAIWTRSGTESVEVNVFRFERRDGAWGIYPAPHSSNSYSTDEAGATVERLMAERPELRLVPEE